MRRDERIVAALGVLLDNDPETTAPETALSPARFSHLFAQTTGMLPSEFLRLLRSYRSELAYAVDILSSLDQES